MSWKWRCSCILGAVALMMCAGVLVAEEEGVNPAAETPQLLSSQQTDKTVEAGEPAPLGSVTGATENAASNCLLSPTDNVACPSDQLVGEMPTFDPSGWTPSVITSPALVIWDNGPFVTHPGGGYNGADASAYPGSVGGCTYGYSCAVALPARIADDFTLATPCTINSIRVYAYQTSGGIPSTLTATNLRIWDGDPSAGGSVVWGDDVTNVMTATDWSGCYRTSDTDYATANTRAIMYADCAVNTTLPAGTYWIDFQIAGSAASGPWANPVQLIDTAGSGNAIQLYSGAWQPVQDSCALFYEDFPFIIDGICSMDPGACCDPYTGICTDGVTPDLCLAPNQFHQNVMCADLTEPCGGIPGACCDDATTICTDGVYALACNGTRFASGVLCADLDPVCGAPVGACCFDDCTCSIEEQAVCTGLGGNWIGMNTTCDMCPCMVCCPAGALQEGELCGEDLNGGCNMVTPAFETINIGDTICGTAWADGGNRDTDWFEIILTTPMTLTFEGEGEFPMIVGYIEQTVPGVAGCGNMPGTFATYVSLDPCVYGGVTTPCLAPGYYYFFIGDQDFYDNPCSTGMVDYTVTMSGVACTAPVGACCNPDGSCTPDLYAPECFNGGGMYWGDGTVCDPNPCPTCCESTVTTFPYSESFESGAPDGWYNSLIATDDFDWSWNSGPTSSSSTGPSAAYEGTWYVYTEASSPNYPTKTAYLDGPCFDLTAVSNPSINFYYHMYGSSMGTLTLQASVDDCATWDDVWTLSGDQGDAWYLASASLAAYDNMTVKLRFYGVTGSSYYSDMAVDAIWVGDGSAITGACCYNDVCQIESAATCTGVYQGDFTTCDPNPCMGACCDAFDQTCYGDYSEADCLALPALTGWYQFETCATFACPSPYCDICWTNTTDDYIVLVQFKQIDNATGQDGACSYGDYTNLVAQVAPGEAANLHVEVFSDGTWTECVTAWFDWNIDGQWTSDEMYQLGCGVDLVADLVINVPATAQMGNSRFRVTEKYSSAATDPCVGGSYGETEDYGLLIGDPIGACCFTDGTCSRETQANCGSLGGTYWGDSTFCAGNDCQPNGIDDGCDIYSGTSMDCNGNFIPDECEPDCNGNGIPDDCDLANCDGSVWCSDCNDNGTIDFCDVPAPMGNCVGTCSEDCQPDGVPDECQLFSAKATLWDNGPFITHPAGGFNGADASAYPSMGCTWGYGCQPSLPARIADDFSLTGPCQINTIRLYAYQTGSGTVSTLTAANVRIWDGDPSAGGTVVWGDDVTNVMTGTDWTGVWRVCVRRPAQQPASGHVLRRRDQHAADGRHVLGGLPDRRHALVGPVGQPGPAARAAWYG